VYFAQLSMVWYNPLMAIRYNNNTERYSVHISIIAHRQYSNQASAI